mgnify:FL=1
MSVFFKDISILLSIFYQNNKRIKFYYLVILIALLVILEIISFSSLVPIISLIFNENLIYQNKYLSLIYEFFEFKNPKEFIVAFIPFALIFFSVSTITSILIIYIQQKFIYDNYKILSNFVVKKYFNLNYKTLSKLDSAEVIKNNLIPIIAFCEGSLNSIVNFFSRSLVIIFFVLIAFLIEPLIAFSILIFLLLLYFLIFNTIKNKMKNLGEIGEISLKEKTKLLNELFLGLREIKVMNLFDFKMEEYRHYDKLLSKSKTFQYVLANSPKYITELVVVFLILSGILISFNLGFDISKTIPTLLMISAIVYKLLPHTNQLFLSLNTLKYQEKLKEIFLEILNYKNEFEDVTTKVSFNSILELKNINFGYDKKKILENFNLTIKKNEIVCLKGKSGSGKTTITNIMSTLLIPDSGDLIIDGKKITSQNKSLKEKIGFVTQNLFFFSGTLKENLILLKKDISDKKIYELLRKVDLYKKFSDLDKGLDYFINFDGSNLSLGEKQRLAIVRCILMEREIIILDEPISSLDKENIEEIKNIIKNLKNHVTFLIISHVDEFNDISDRVIKIEK